MAKSRIEINCPNCVFHDVELVVNGTPVPLEGAQRVHFYMNIGDLPRLIVTRIPGDIGRDEEVEIHARG
jgi:hypothetical protein